MSSRFLAGTSNLAHAVGVRLLQSLQMLAELIKAGFPESPIVFEPVDHALEGSRLEVAGTPLGLAGLRNEACDLQHLKVFRYRRHAHFVRLREFVHGCIASCQARENSAA